MYGRLLVTMYGRLLVTMYGRHLVTMYGRLLAAIQDYNFNEQLNNENKSS
jgi:hypothetical protein